MSFCAFVFMFCAKRLQSGGLLISLRKKLPVKILPDRGSSAVREPGRLPALSAGQTAGQIHLPLVKSGMATGLLPSRMDCSDSTDTATQPAVS